MLGDHLRQRAAYKNAHLHAFHETAGVIEVCIHTNTPQLQPCSSVSKCDTLSRTSGLLSVPQPHNKQLSRPPINKTSRISVQQCIAQTFHAVWIGSGLLHE